MALLASLRQADRMEFSTVINLLQNGADQLIKVGEQLTKAKKDCCSSEGHE